MEPQAKRNSRSLYNGAFYIGRLSERRRYWNVFIKGTTHFPALQQRFGSEPGIRMTRLDARYLGTTFHAEPQALSALLDFVASLNDGDDLRATEHIGPLSLGR